MKRLAADGAVNVRRDGKFSRYVISEEMTIFLKRAGFCRGCNSLLSTGEGSTIPHTALAGPAES